jgi:hypothetical protein
MISRVVYAVLLMISFAVPSHAQTYYSYQSGNFSASSTWTTDPSGTVQAPVGGPAVINGASYVVLNGRTVTLSANSGLTGGLTISEGGILDMQTFAFTATLSSLAGNGSLRLASGSFPTATTNTFVQAGGGQTTYYSNNNYTLSTTQTTYNELRIIGTGTKTIASNITTNSYFRILAGTVQIGNNATIRTLTVNGDLYVESGASLTVGNFNAIHNVDLYGDFENRGTVRFTNQGAPNYTTATNTGGALVTFRGLSENVLWCRGTTDFYRLHINKGTEQSFGLRVLSTNAANFRLFGPNNGGGNNFAPPTDDKALVIFNGYLRLGNNISIPTLTEGGQDFNVRTSALMWVDSATVSTTITGQNGTGYQAATVYGRLLVTAGSFSTGDAAGVVLGDTGSPIVELQGGTMDISQIWAVSGNTMSLIISGGTFNIRAQGEAQGGAMLNITGTNALWDMSGGTLNFLNSVVNAGEGIDFRGTGNISGGTVNVNLTGTHTFGINTTVPFYNFTATRSGAGTLTLQGLNTSSTFVQVLNNATLNTNVTLDLNTNNTSWRVGGNFTISNGATLNLDNTSEIRMNGSSGNTQVLTFSNAGPSIPILISAPTNGGTVQLAGNNPTVTQALRIQSGTFDTNGRTVSVSNVLENSGTHIGAGAIQSTGGNALTISGNGSGVFNNLTLNTTNGANGAINTTFTAAMQIDGVFTLNQNRRVDIGSNNLSFGQNASIVAGAGGFSANRMIIMNGTFGGGSVSRTYHAGGPSFTFPIGSTTNYRPATFIINAATTWGTVTIRSVNNEHPSVTTTGRSLSTYWRVTQSGFVNPSGITALFTYPNANLVTGGNVTEAEYRPAYFDRTALGWVKVGSTADVDDATNIVTFTGLGLIQGEYTAGDINPTDPFAAVNLYYSRQTGNWETPATWSLNQANGSGTQVVPPAGAIVIIQSNHTVTITANNKDVSSLTFRANATLDNANTNGHVFDIIQADASSARWRSRRDAYFPTGDWSQFTGNPGATIEYYASVADITLPAAPVTYFLLELNAATGRVITLPAADLTVFSNLSITGDGTVQTNASVRNFAVNGNWNINDGTFTFRNNAYSATLGGTLTVASGATFRGIGGGGATTHTLSIAGNVVNNGTMTLDSNADVALTFTGASNASWTGSGTSANGIFTITVNKGTSASSRLDFNVANGGTVSATGNSLILVNGTFRHMGPQTITLTTGNFTIPATCGLENTGTGTLNIGASNADAADLLLGGSLLVSNGTVNIGNTTDNNNNNDIEYSQAGLPSITVSGGTLFVRGQLRRNLVNQSGALQFELSGTGTVRIHGRNPNTGRGNFEILNTGSTFTMSGTSTLTVHRGTGGAGIADVLITPENYSVTGGTVILGPDGGAINPGNQTIDLNAGVPLGNLRLMRLAANTTTGRLEVSHLRVDNAITLDAGTTLDASTNNRDVSVGGNFLVNGTYTAGNNTTTFESTAAQTFTMNSAVTIANLVVTKSAGTLQLAGTNNLVVTTSFELNQGTLNDGGRTITIQGNTIANNGTHSSTGGGAVIFTTGILQNVSGSGIFGNVTLNNANGITFSGNHTINGTLTLTNGILIINTNLLTLGTTATISGASAARYIRTNGQLSDQGVRKNYPSGALNFTFPIGSPGKYTPATINVTANSAVGTVTIKPVNTAHPTTTSALNTQLNYYWSVVSTGFFNPTVTHTYNYLNADVNGTEASYVPGRLFNFAWTSGAAINGTVTPASDLFTLTNVGFISGDYTAGLAAEFGTVLTFYSRNNRPSDDWSAASTWSTVGHADNTSPASPPNGNPVRIASGHTVFMSANTQTAGALELNGTLNLSTTIGHTFGTVTGTGVLQIGNTNVVFPGGNFDVFNGPNGGTVEYTANADQTLPPVATYKNLRFLGTSTKSLPAQDITVYGDVEFGGGNFNANSRSVAVRGNWTNNTSNNAFVPGTATVTFEGASTQTIGGNFTSGFYNLRINTPDPTGVNMTAPVNVTGQLQFVQGYLNTGSQTVALGTTGSITGESSTSYGRGIISVSRSVGAAAASSMGNIGVDIAAGPDVLGTVNVTRVAGVAGSVAYGWTDPVLRRWIITAQNQPVSGRQVTFSWMPGEDNGNDLSSIQFARRPTPGTGDFTFVGPAINVANTTPRTATLTTTAFSEWAAGDGDNLPVELVNLSLSEEGGKILLTWTTLTEENNYGFHVQRRIEPGERAEALKQSGHYISDTWETLGFVEGKGTYYNPVDYRYTSDKPAFVAKYQYRLLQEDYDSRQTEYGPLSWTMSAPAQTALKLPYPNPFNPETVIPVELSADTRLKLEVFDLLGRRVAILNDRNLPAGVHQFRFDARQMASGVYLIRLQAGSSVQLRKVTLIR